MRTVVQFKFAYMPTCSSVHAKDCSMVVEKIVKHYAAVLHSPVVQSKSTFLSWAWGAHGLFVPSCFMLNGQILRSATSVDFLGFHCLCRLNQICIEPLGPRWASCKIKVPVLLRTHFSSKCTDDSSTSTLKAKLNWPRVSFRHIISCNSSITVAFANLSRDLPCCGRLLSSWISHCCNSILYWPFFEPNYHILSHGAT